ncbi:MAG: helix-turn-helix domain-containing protein [Planctomycetaceae bacterium]|nr:helix-turn-helix domain-containing protein [Planctomycetaceae bacterium]
MPPSCSRPDADGPNRKDQDIADTFFCTRQCIENLRKRLVTEGFDIAQNGKKRNTPPRGKCLDGEQEAKIIALRLSDPPKGRNGWTLRLLAEKVVELEIAPEISHVTVRSTLKKQNHGSQSAILGNPSKIERGVRREDGGSTRYLRSSLQN